jgi:hypothetical protein
MGMFKGLFGSRPTTKSDVVLAAGAAVMAVWKAADVLNQYKKEHDTEKEIKE